MDLSKYLEMFLEESREHLQNLNTGLLDLEQDPGSVQIINELFRSAHTLKGMSATMGFMNIAELTHEMENLLQLFRSGERILNERQVEVLFKALDTLEQMVEEVANGGEITINVDAFIDMLRSCAQDDSIIPSDQALDTDDGSTNLQDCIELNEYEKNVLLDAKAQGINVWIIKISIREACVMKSARAFMVFQQLESLGEVIKTCPSVQDIEEERFDNSFMVVLLTSGSSDDIQRALDSVSELEATLIKAIDEVQKKVQAKPSEEKVVENDSTPSTSETDNTSKTSQKDAVENLAKPKTSLVKTSSTIRVEIERLDALMNLVGELVINKTRLSQIGRVSGNTDLHETVEQMDRIFMDLQNLVMKVRMVPVDQVFSRFPRMVRDLTKELGKNINLVISGEETELDRTVIDEIGDPLVHLLRNSIDHGIEMPKVREELGKDKVATVKLEARHEGNHVVIEVSDDGRGIDPQKIKEKSITKGLVTQGEADALSDEELVQLIFRPGVSTADKVTDISGRGVGLDAVRTKIETLSGECRIITTPGKGTTFRIQLPLTLAIIQALLVRVQDEVYALPLSFIEETTSLYPQDIKNVENREVMILRGRVLPLLRLSQLVELPFISNKEEELLVVIVRKGGKSYGLVVDELIGQQEIVIKPLGNVLTGISGIAGATILGSGQVSLILDVSTLIKG